MPGPSSSTDEHDLAVDPLDGRLDRVPGSVWRSAFSSRLSVSRCSSSRAPSISAPGGAATQMWWSPATGSSSPAASVTTSERSSGACGATRPASARASSSRSATRRRIRREERSADAAASRCSPSSSISSSSRLASTEVSGVRSSCDASATNCALARERRLRLGARLVQRLEHALQRRRELGDLVVRLRVGDRQRRVARARDRARGVGEPVIGAMARARGREAGEQRQRGAAEHAEAEEDAHAVRRRAATSETGARTGRRPRRSRELDGRDSIR